MIFSYSFTLRPKFNPRLKIDLSIGVLIACRISTICSSDNARLVDSSGFGTKLGRFNDALISSISLGSIIYGSIFFLLHHFSIQVKNADIVCDKSKAAVWNDLTDKWIYGNVILTGDVANQNLKPFIEGILPSIVCGDIAGKFAANRTLYIIDQYIPNLKKLKAIAMDAGLQDRGISGSTRKLHEVLDKYDIPHMYESYEGDHINRIAERIRTKVLPFFSEHLKFD